MATGLENYPNTTGITADYPNKNIKDNDGSMNGTPFNTLVYADMHQTLAKFLRLSGIAANALPENETNGFQYIEAMRNVLAFFGDLYLWDRSSSPSQYSAQKNPLVIASHATNLGDFALQDSTVATERHLEHITFVNKSANPLNVFPDSGGSDTIDGGASITIGIGETVTLVLDKTNGDWIVVNKQVSYSQRIEFDGTSAITITPRRTPQLVMIRPIGGGGALTIDDSANVEDLACVKFVNVSGGAVNLVRANGSDKINSASATYSIANGARLELTLNKSAADYEITAN